MSQGIGAAVAFVEEQIEAGAFDGGAARCRATTRKGKPCQRTPLPEREYCPVAPAPRDRPRDRVAARGLRARRAALARDRPRAADARSRRRATRRTRRGRGETARRFRSPQVELNRAVSHDADKLIRQLSLVAFLMAERRPLTARDIKSCVEGYSEMSDEAFARRFYSDRSELLGLGRPARSPSATSSPGEELYTLRSEQYFLPPLELSDDELAALQTALFLLEGQFAYAEPLRLALQNLALGRPGAVEAPTESAVERERAATTTTRRTCRAGSTKLDAAISKQRTVRFQLLGDRPRRGDSSERSTRTRSSPTTASGTSSARISSGTTSARSASPAFRATSRSPRGASATSASPTDFDPSEFRGRPPWQVGETVGEARIEVGAGHRLVGRARVRGRGRLEDGVFTPSTPSIRACSPPGSCGRTGARARSTRRSSWRRSSARLHGSSSCTRGRRRCPPGRERGDRRRPRTERPAGPVPPSASRSSRRCSPTCSPPAARASGR